MPLGVLGTNEPTNAIPSYKTRKTCDPESDSKLQFSKMIGNLFRLVTLTGLILTFNFVLNNGVGIHDSKLFELV